MPTRMDVQDSDNKIIAIALRLKIEGNDIAVISRDLNMRVKCDSFGIECHDYQPQQAVESVDSLFDGAGEIIIMVCSSIFQASFLAAVEKMTKR